VRNGRATPGVDKDDGMNGGAIFGGVQSRLNPHQALAEAVTREGGPIGGLPVKSCGNGITRIWSRMLPPVPIANIWQQCVQGTRICLIARVHGYQTHFCHKHLPTLSNKPLIAIATSHAKRIMPGPCRVPAQRLVHPCEASQSAASDEFPGTL